jgi:hypothetical protein
MPKNREEIDNEYEYEEEDCYDYDKNEKMITNNGTT